MRVYHTSQDEMDEITTQPLSHVRICWGQTRGIIIIIIDFGA